MLKVNKGGTIYPIKLYDTVDATGHQQADVSALPVHIGDKTYYARMTQNLRSDISGGATPLRCKTPSGAVYQVAQRGEWVIFVPGSDGQTVCVSVNGNTYRGANTLWFAEGTAWNAWVEADGNHYPGNLNISSGTLNGDVHLTVSGATYVPNGSLTVYVDRNEKTRLVVPDNITVIHTEGGGQTHNIRVTPGKTYYVHEWVGSRTYGATFNAQSTSAPNEPFWIYEMSKNKGNVTLSWSKTINGWGTDYDAR